MKIAHRISFPGGKEFEQHECIFEMDIEDIQGEATVLLNPLQKFQVMSTLVMINALLYQRAEGYIDKEAYKERKARVLSLLAEPVKKAVEEVLKNGS